MVLQIEYRYSDKSETTTASTRMTGRLNRVMSDCDDFAGEGTVAGHARTNYSWGGYVEANTSVKCYTPTLQILDDHYEFGLGHRELPGKNERGEPGAAQYGCPVKVVMPLSGFRELKGSSTFTRQSEGCQDIMRPGDSLTLTWSFTPAGESPQLEALPTVASTVQRGERVVLDASRSTGSIQDYRWTFNGNAGAEKQGVNAEVVALDDLQVTLTVSDGQSTSSKTVSVKVTPRSHFRTRFEELSAEGLMPDSEKPICRMMGTDAHKNPEYWAEWTGGENVCAEDPEAHHILHPGIGSQAYTIAQVDDPGGPFDGYYYFKDWNTHIQRRILVNAYVVEAATTLPGFGTNFYQGNRERGTDIDGYLKAVREHEKEHSRLMAEALKEKDPAIELERAFGSTEDALRAQADKALREAEDRIHLKAKDPLPETWSGVLAVPQELEQTRGPTWRMLPAKVGGAGHGGF